MAGEAAAAGGGGAFGALRFLIEVTNKASKGLLKIDKDYGQVEKTMSRVGGRALDTSSALDKAGKATEKSFRSHDKTLRTHIDKRMHPRKGLPGLQRELNKRYRLSRRRMTELGKSTKALTGLMGQLGIAVSAGAGFMASLNAAMDFQDQMQSIRQQMGSTSEARKEYEKLFLSTGARLGAAEDDLAAIAAVAAREQMKAGDSLKEFTDFAIMAGMAFGESAGSVAEWSSMLEKLYGTAPAELKKVGSALEFVSNNSRLTAAEGMAMAESFSSAAQKLPKDIRRKVLPELFAIGGALAEKAIPADTMVDAFSKMLDRTDSEGQKLRSVMSQVINFRDLEAAVREGDLSTVFTSLKEGMDRLPTNQVRMFASQWSDLTGMDADAILKIQELDPKTFTDLAKGAQEAFAAGTLVGREFEELNKTWRTLWNQIKAVTKTVMISIGRPMLELATAVITPVVKAVRFLADAFQALPGPVKDVVGILASLALGVGVIVPIIAAAGPAIAAVGPALAGAFGVVVPILGPIGLLAGAVAGLFVAFKHGPKILDKLTERFPKLQGAVDVLKVGWEKMTIGLKEGWKVLKQVVSQVADAFFLDKESGGGIVGILTDLAMVPLAPLKALFDIGKGLFDIFFGEGARGVPLGDKVSAAFELVGKELMELFLRIPKMVISVVPKLWNAFSKGVESFDWGKLFEDALYLTLRSFQALVFDIPGLIIKGFGFVLRGFVSLVEGMFKGALKAFFGDAAGPLIDHVTEGFKILREGISWLFGGIGSAWQAVPDAIRGAYDAVVGALDRWWSAFKEGFDALKEAVSSIVAWIGDKITAVGDLLLDPLRLLAGFVDRIVGYFDIDITGGVATAKEEVGRTLAQEAASNAQLQQQIFLGQEAPTAIGKIAQTGQAGAFAYARQAASMTPEDFRDAVLALGSTQAAHEELGRLRAALNQLEGAINMPDATPAMAEHLRAQQDALQAQQRMAISAIQEMQKAEKAAPAAPPAITASADPGGQTFEVKVPANAGGGAYDRPQLSIVGETPEVVVPIEHFASMTSAVTSAAETMAFMADRMAGTEPPPLVRTLGSLPGENVPATETEFPGLISPELIVPVGARELFEPSVTVQGGEGGDLGKVEALLEQLIRLQREQGREAARNRHRVGRGRDGQESSEHHDMLAGRGL